MSDALCRLSTGGGFSTRELYTNAEEMVLEASPVAQAVLKHMETNPYWVEQPTELYQILRTIASLTSATAFPQGVAGMPRALSRIAPHLRGVGIEVTFHPCPGMPLRHGWDMIAATKARLGRRVLVDPSLTTS